MKPLLLEISGLGSFESTQTINFEKLMSSGIFGVFGKTGAGKSTILDSLTLALYNTIDRYDNENKNEMINANRKECYVSFIFSIKNKGEKILYKVDRSYRLDLHGKLKPKKHIISRKLGDIYEPVAEGVKEVNKQVLDIISLNYDDFSKAIILPQGKFNDFINLNSSEKRKMLERIFGLEEYGQKLTKSYNELLKSVDTEFKILNEKAKVYDEYSVSSIEKNKTDLKLVEENSIVLSKKLENKIERNNKLQEDIKNANVLKDIIRINKELNAGKEEIDKLKNILSSKEIYNKIMPLKAKNKEYIEKLKVAEIESVEITKLVAKYSQDIENTDISLSEISKKIENNKKKLIETKLDTEYLQNINKGISQEENLYTIIKDIEKLDTEENLKEKSIANFIKEIEIYKNDSIDKNKKVEALKLDIKNLEEDKKYWENSNKIALENVNKKERFKNTSDRVFQAFDEQIEVIVENEENIKKFEREIQDFRIQNLAVTLADGLVEGNPCPVCGSKDHPQIVQAIEKTYAEKKTSQIDEAKNNIIKANSEINRFLNGLEKRASTCIEKSKILNIELEKLIAELIKIDEAIIRNTLNIENAQKNINSIVVNKKNLKDRKCIIEKQLEEIKVTYKISGSFKEKLDEINKVQKDRIDLENDLVSQEKLYDDFEKNKNNLSIKDQENKIKLASINTLITECKQNIEDINNEIENIFIEENFDRSNLDDIENIDFVLIENIVNDYNDKVTITKNKYEEFKVFENLNFDDLIVERDLLVKEIESTEADIILNSTKKGSYEEKINNFHKMLKEKTEIEEKLKIVGRKLDEILSLKELLRGEKFVEFIARQDLSEVVYFASKEFNKLSNGKYNLKLSETNLDIEVIDNLQGGKTRSVKSLSGGETFIISLCLALSLSKKIQMKKNSIIEFFFLDEGFGSLDNEALDRVVDTLTSLKNSNINIGIITHVDKLKERVPKTLFVENNAFGTVVRLD